MKHDQKLYNLASYLLFEVKQIKDGYTHCGANIATLAEKIEEYIQYRIEKEVAKQLNPPPMHSFNGAVCASKHHRSDYGYCQDCLP